MGRQGSPLKAWSLVLLATGSSVKSAYSRGTARRVAVGYRPGTLPTRLEISYASFLVSVGLRGDRWVDVGTGREGEMQMQTMKVGPGLRT